MSHLVSDSYDRFRPRPSHAAILRLWRRVLRVQMDEADSVIANVRRRAPELAARVPVPSRAARSHLEDAILPGAALYLELRDRLGHDRAYALTATCMAAAATRRRRLFRLLDRTPWFYPIFRYGTRRGMRRAFSPPEFESRRVEDTAQRVRFDMTRCYYLDTLTRLGIPELTALYCHNDDVIYGDLEHVRFVRNGTLAQGCDRCDFCFERRSGRTGPAPARAAER